MLVGNTGVRIEQVLNEEARRLPWGSTFVVVTTRITEPLQRSLLALARRGLRPVLILCGDWSEGLEPLTGRVAVYRIGVGSEEEVGYAPVAATR